MGRNCITVVGHQLNGGRGKIKLLMGGGPFKKTKNYYALINVQKVTPTSELK